MSLQLKAVGRTDIGLVRSGNEDCLHIDRKNHVYAVLDGMGGHQAGEVASITASDIVHRAFSNMAAELLDDASLGIDLPLPPSGKLLLKSIRLANRAVFGRAQGNPSLSGMGTTIVATAFEADIMSIVHVGDSRAYRLTESGLEPLTHDHSWVAEIQAAHHLSEREAASFVGKNVITRALGVRGTVEVDFRNVKVKPGDQFILCSDGLCGFADDGEIFDAASEYRHNLTELVDSLIQLANDRGGSDNVTVIALQVVDIEASSLPELEVFTLREESEEISAAEDQWLTRIAESQTQPAPDIGVPKRGISKIALLVFFLLFIIVAVLVIWMLPGK